MNKAQTKPMPAPVHSAATAFEHLEGVLRQLLAEHEQLLTLTIEHRNAIAAADARALNACIGRQNAVVQRVAALERQRQGIVGAIMRMPTLQGPARLAQTQPTLSAVTAQAPEPVRSRLTAVSGALRELLQRLHKEHLAMKLAAETLSSHMEGLMRQVCQRLSHAGTYARGGNSAASVQVVSSVDLRS